MNCVNTFYGCNECSCYSVIIPYTVGAVASEGLRELGFSFGAELNDIRQTSLCLEPLRLKLVLDVKRKH